MGIHLSKFSGLEFLSLFFVVFHSGGASVARFISYLLFLVVLVFSSSAFAEDSEVARQCRQLLSGSDAGDVAINSSDPVMDAKTQTFEFSELILPGEKNLAVRYPFIVMNAPQRFLDIVYSAGVEEFPDPTGQAGTRRVFNLISSGHPWAGGQRINEHYRAIERVMQSLELQASGSKSGRNTVLLVGDPGTGKSLFLKILKNAAHRATLMDERFYAFTFEWTHLDQIPSIKDSPFVPKAARQEGTEVGYPAAQGDSPFVLLPEPVQDSILGLVGPEVERRIGRTPRPRRHLNFKDEFLRDEIIKHYATQKGSALTNIEIVEALSKHVRITRKILGTTENTPLINAQGDEVNERALFAAEHILVGNLYGPDHPMAWNLTRIPRANGSMVLLDEFLKNPEPMQRTFLEAFQSGEISANGVPGLETDIFWIAADNTANLKKLKEKDPRSPLLSRLDRAHLGQSVRPLTVAKTLAMEIPDLYMRELGKPEAEYVSVNSRSAEENGLDLLFPPNQDPRTPIVTPAGRFALTVGSGEQQVHIMPHSLEYLAMVSAISRCNFDPSRVRFGQSFPMVKNQANVFRDPVSRLRALMGMSEMTRGQLIELAEISEASSEGEFGLMHRDAVSILGEAIFNAKKPENGGVVTPMLIRDVLFTKLRGQEILEGEEEDAAKLALFARLVWDEFTMPEMATDLRLAVTGGDSATVNKIYSDLVQEIAELHRDPDAEDYYDNHNQRKTIDRARIEKIAKAYARVNRQRFEIGEIANWLVQFSAVASASQQDGRALDRKHEGLLNAIRQYLADTVMESHKVTLDMLLDVISGSETQASEAQRARAHDVMKSLELHYGYTQGSVRRLVQAVRSVESK